MTTATTHPGVAVIAGGKLLLHRPDGSRRELHSEFVQNMIDRAERHKERHAWKDGSMGWNTSAIPSEVAALSLATAHQGGQRIADFVDVSARDPERMLYAVRTESFGGLFEYTIASAEERRLAHKAEFRISEIDAHHEDGRLVAALTFDDGTSNLATMTADGGRLSEFTEGDSLDQAPRWARDTADTVVYQSAGIARNVSGFIGDYSNFRIEALDLESGHHEVLAETPGMDLLSPTRLADGTLLFIRRPHEPLHKPPTAWNTAKDLLLLPWRVMMAIFWFLNMFTMLFTNKPLTSAGGPQQEGPSSRQLVLYGRVIEMQKQKRRGQPPEVVTVPQTWELVSRSSQGDERVVARGVGHYDVNDDGAIVYTDGNKVWHLEPGGQPALVATETLIERVAVLR